MADRTTWDRDYAGPGTETTWDRDYAGPGTSTLWDLVPEIIGRLVRVRWQSVRRRVKWIP